MKVLSQPKRNVVYNCDCNGKGTSRCKGCEDTNITVIPAKKVYKKQKNK